MGVPKLPDHKPVTPTARLRPGGKDERMTTETEKTDVAERLAKALQNLINAVQPDNSPVEDYFDNPLTDARAALAAYEAGKGETREADHRVTAFLNRVADFTRDGEITPDYPDGYDLSGDAAFDDLAWCINEARDIVGRPPEQH